MIIDQPRVQRNLVERAANPVGPWNFQAMIRYDAGERGSPRIRGQVERTGGHMAPFNTPWSTFLAWIVIGGTVLLSIVWAILGVLSKGKKS